MLFLFRSYIFGVGVGGGVGSAAFVISTSQRIEVSFVNFSLHKFDPTVFEVNVVSQLNSNL